MLEPLAELGVHADVFGEQHREAPDPLDVGAGVLVSELDRHRQSLHGLGLGDLELRQGAFQLARAVLDLVFERRPAVLAKAPPERDRRARERGQAAGHEQGCPRKDRSDGRRHAEHHPRQQANGWVPAPGATARRPPAGLVATAPTHESTDPPTLVASGTRALRSDPTRCGSPKKAGLDCTDH